MSIHEEVIRDVFDAFQEEEHIMLPRLLDRAILAGKIRGAMIQRDELRRAVINACKPGGWLVATNQGIMRGTPVPVLPIPTSIKPPMAWSGKSSPSYQQVVDMVEREREKNFFRTSRCDNTCPKCSAPLPCQYH